MNLLLEGIVYDPEETGGAYCDAEGYGRPSTFDSKISTSRPLNHVLFAANIKPDVTRRQHGRMILAEDQMNLRKEP
jgi:hypothetical protein